MPTLTVIYLLSAAALGVLLGAWLGSRIGASNARAARETSENLQSEIEKRDGEIAALRAQLTSAQERAVRAELDAEHLRDVKPQLEAAEKARDAFRHDLAAAQLEVRQLKTELESERKKVEEFLPEKFKSLAQDILDKNSRLFTEQNQTNLGTLLDPIREKFTEFQQKVTELREQGIQTNAELKTQIEGLSNLNTRLSHEANSLVQALKGSSKTQGDWGEFILEQVLESAGLRKGEQYRVQQTFTNGEGKAYRPDVILSLPEGKHLVIDSKVSLRDYTEYSSADDEATRNAALDRHIAAIHNHIKGLDRREYQNLHGLQSIDFVVMFVPIEPAYMLALANDHGLWQKAWDQNVLLVGPSTLLFVVRTVAQLWRTEDQNRNAQAIADRGARLYDKLVNFVNDLKTIGDSLDRSKSTYESAVRKLQGNGGAIRQAEMLRALGVKPTKRLPGQLVEMSNQEIPNQEPLEIAACTEDEADE
ncbi:MAG: DNA recombination protein RmuC [Acidobacteriaceae bacterium]